MNDATEFTLLLVDDNPTNLALLAQIVEMELPQVRVLTAESAAAGLELTAQSEIDGAFLDVQMPVMSGIELCRRFKEDEARGRFPVVLMTAHIATAELRAEGLEAGAYDFISQPISNVEMLARIRVMLRLRQNEKRLLTSNAELRQQVATKTSALRWLSGLLMAGGETPAEEDRELAMKLSHRLPEDSRLNIEQFSGQLFQDMPLRWQRTVLKLALLDEIPLVLAERLAEIPDVEGALDYLWRHNFFVEEQSANLFLLQRPLRERLRLQAKLDLTEEERGEVYGLAADWYLHQGQPLLSLNYLFDAGHYAEAELLLCQQGLQLVAGTWMPGLVETLDKLPDEKAAKRGWLALFSGIGQLQKNSQVAGEWLELSLTRFVANRDLRGELLARIFQAGQSMLGDGYFNQDPETLTRIAEIISQEREVLDDINLAGAYTALAAGSVLVGTDLNSAERYAREGLQHAIRADAMVLQVFLRQITAYLGLLQGRLALARAEIETCQTLVQHLPVAAPCRLVQQLLGCDLLLCSGDYENLQQYHRRLEKLLGRSFLQQGALGPLLCRIIIEKLLATGQQRLARDRVELCAENSTVMRNPHLLELLRLYRGMLWEDEETEPGGEDAELGELQPLRDDVGGLRWILQGYILRADRAARRHELDRAEQWLERALDISLKQGEGLYRAGIFAQWADLHLSRGQEQAAVKPLVSLLEQLERTQCDHFFLLSPQLLQRLLPLASRHQLVTEKTVRMARRHLDSALLADGSLLPLLEIKTLGRSTMGQQDKILFDCSEFGSISRKMLIFLTISPGQKLGLEHLLGLLWPDSSESRARASFDSNFSRLRKTIDAGLLAGSSRDYLVLERGVLALHHVSIDSLQFEEQVRQGQLHLRRKEPWQAGLAFRNANRLWAGEFLVGQDLPDELVMEQQRLTELRLEMIDAWSDLLVADDSDDEAESLLQSGLRLEPTREQLVRRLYGLHLQRKEMVQAKKILEGYHLALLADDYSDAEANEIVQDLQRDINGPSAPELGFG